MASATPSSLQLPNTTLPRTAEGRFLSSVKTAASQSPSGLHGSRMATWAGGYWHFVEILSTQTTVTPCIPPMARGLGGLERGWVPREGREGIYPFSPQRRATGCAPYRGSPCYFKNMIKHKNTNKTCRAWAVLSIDLQC